MENQHNLSEIEEIYSHIHVCMYVCMHANKTKPCHPILAECFCFSLPFYLFFGNRRFASVGATLRTGCQKTAAFSWRSSDGLEGNWGGTLALPDVSPCNLAPQPPAQATCGTCEETLAQSDMPPAAWISRQCLRVVVQAFFIHSPLGSSMPPQKGLFRGRTVLWLYQTESCSWDPFVPWSQAE